MSNEHEPVKPTPFSAAPAPTGPMAGEPAASHTPGRWVVPGFVLLLAMALAVFLWLPGKVPEVSTVAPAKTVGNNGDVAHANPAPKPAVAPTARAATPYADGLAARDRDAAQAVLELVLDAQFALEEQGVERWAAESYTRATRLAGEGDEAYRRREFTTATSTYQAALDELTAIQSGIPGMLASAIETTRQALEASAVEQAVQWVEIAGLLAPDSEEVSALRARVEAAPEVASLREQSALLASSSQLESALETLDAALVLDAEHKAVAAERERLRAALLENNFSAAMSAGYAALAEYRFTAARAAFRRAAALKPGADETASALTEVATEETAHTLRQLSAAGSRAETEERWQDAIELYEKALALDASVLFANEGLERARPRATVDAQLKLLLSEPGRLEDIKVADATARLLDDARSFGAPDARLSEQVNQLTALLRRANTPVTVTLHSDAATDIVVHKVARLGRFERHSLTLRPGTYTAVGSRRGYRDVRESFTVAPGEGAAITIRCTEPI
ncbi:MAG: hypothetical protein HKN19_09340 [Halioglobus sp.]|nr:hypothetical protein [Halioglobus sp.]